jgi:type I restriction enzyme R subunit
VLSPNIQQVSGELVDVNEKRRGDFYDALTAFSSCLKVALQSATFYDDTSFTYEDHRLYKETVKQLSNLRRVVQQDAGERVDYDKYALDVKKLLDKHVVGVEIKDPTGFYDVGRMGESKPEEWDDAKTRNETDKIKTRITRTIEQQLQDDPYAQEAFSKLLRQAIEAAEQLFDHPLKQLMLFSEFEQQVNARRLDDIPDVFNGNHHAQAYFGVFKQVLPKVMSVADEQVQDKWVKFAFEIDEAVEKAVAENSINPQSIEASIRKALLPTMFRECKSAGYGMDQARDAVERVVQITRVGLAG